MKKTYKILGIAPYQNLRTAILTAADIYEIIELTVYS